VVVGTGAVASGAGVCAAEVRSIAVALASTTIQVQQVRRRIEVNLLQGVSDDKSPPRNVNATSLALPRRIRRSFTLYPRRTAVIDLPIGCPALDTQPPRGVSVW
jgi:hypothetical protein